METFLKQPFKYIRHSFLSYLWGMETCHPTFWLHQILLLFILPMRNGNSSSEIPVVFLFSFLFILPMRNGNFFKIATSPSAYILFILPMRNGNFQSCISPPKPSDFLSYLWGMEGLDRNGRWVEKCKVGRESEVVIRNIGIWNDGKRWMPNFSLESRLNA